MITYCFVLFYQIMMTQVAFCVVKGDDALAYVYDMTYNTAEEQGQHYTNYYISSSLGNEDATLLLTTFLRWMNKATSFNRGLDVCFCLLTIEI